MKTELYLWGFLLFSAFIIFGCATPEAPAENPAQESPPAEEIKEINEGTPIPDEQPIAEEKPEPAVEDKKE